MEIGRKTTPNLVLIKGVTNKYPQYDVRYILEEQKSSDRENIVAILILNSMV